MASKTNRIATLPDTRSGTAERLVDAARTIIIRDGLAALTFNAVEAEAGVSRSLIHYHFGGRSGLLLAVVDTIFAKWESAAEIDSRSGGETIDALASDLELSSKISADRDTTLLFIELLPHILRTEELRQRYQDRNRIGMELTYRALLPLLGPNGDECAEDLSKIVVTMMTGLGVEFVIDPHSVDHARLYKRWQDIMLSYVGNLRTAPASDQHFGETTSQTDKP